MNEGKKLVLDEKLKQDEFVYKLVEFRDKIMVI